MAFSLVFNGEGGDGDGTAGQGGGQAWLTAMPSGRRPAVLGRRQREGSSPNGRDPQGLGEQGD
jgi:hypothetical protein